MNRNPFPADPVATYGVPMIKTCDSLNTVSSARKELVGYLSAYAKADTRYGGIVALAGAHGSGKTHLLLYLHETCRTLTSFRIGCVYVKPDTPGLFSVYRGAIEAIGRIGIIQLLDTARRELAKRESERTHITESISTRIDQTTDLNVLINDNTVDADAIENALDAALHSSGVPSDTIEALKLCESSSGEKAFQWLLGSDVLDLETLGLSRLLRQTESTVSGVSSEDSVAIDGLSLLALLHRVAGSPFVVLIDQFDVLLPRAVEEKLSYPAITTFMETMKRQMSLVIIAGSEAAWRRLPPDVPPRVRGRALLKVGALTRDEIGLLVDALMDTRRTLEDNTLAALDELTGGNPREVLAISHQLYEKTSGNMNSATADDVTKSGLRSGTVVERARLARALTDEIISDYGRISRDAALPDGRIVDRVVRQKDRVVVAILLVQASDSIDETTQARNLRDTIGSIRQAMAGAPVIAVTVGYTTAEVRSLFKPAATVIPFDDRTYKTQLEAEMVRLDSAAAEPAKEDATKTTAILDRITRRLEMLENARRDEAGKAQERFEAGAAKALAPEIREHELKTRWQLLEELDLVVAHAAVGDEMRERESIRLILVNNETSRNDRLLDDLGGLYLDLLNVASSAFDDSTYIGDTIRAAKAGIVAAMRARLKRRTFFNDALAHPIRTAILTGVLIALLGQAYYTWFYLDLAPTITSAFQHALVRKFAFVLTGALGFGGTLYAVLFLANPALRWRRRVAGIRSMALRPRTTADVRLQAR